MRWPWIGVLVLGGVGGCAKSPPPSLPPVVAVRPSAPAASPEFVQLQQAAEEAESAGGELALRTSYTPFRKEQLRTRLAGAVAKAVSATRAPVTFAYTPRAPFEPVPNQIGWRAIGRCLRWETEEALEAGDYDRAIDKAGQAVRLGFVLTGGGAADASLGYVIADEARLALVGYLPQMGAGQLNRLAESLEASVSAKPPLETVIANEENSTQLAIQAIQNAYLAKTLARWEDLLGLGARNAVRYVQELSPDEARDYFAGFAEEARLQAGNLRQRAAVPAAKREAVPKATLRKVRPWWRFSKHFIETARPLLDIDAEVTARMRLTALTARLLAARKTTGSVPRRLKNLTKSIPIDPYSGEPFPFQTDGREFLIYSVGSNGTDDGGDTDDAFENPDLTLER